MRELLRRIRTERVSPVDYWLSVLLAGMLGAIAGAALNERGRAVEEARTWEQATDQTWAQDTTREEATSGEQE